MISSRLICWNFFEGVPLDCEATVWFSSSPSSPEELRYLRFDCSFFVPFTQTFRISVARSVEKLETMSFTSSNLTTATTTLYYCLLLVPLLLLLLLLPYCYYLTSTTTTTTLTTTAMYLLEVYQVYTY